MKKIFVGLCLIGFNLLADTNVFVRNNTPFTFNVENKFNAQSSDKRMKLHSRKIEPLKRTKVVGFSRNVGIKDGETYTITSLLTNNNFKRSIDLQQRMKGEAVGSKMWWGIAYPGQKTVFYDNNKNTWDKPVRFKLKDAKGNDHNFMIRAKAYEAGTYNDIEYVISGYNEHKTYRIKSTQGKPNEINVLSYNTFLIAVGPFFKAPARTTRARLMVDEIKGYDVLVLNELFDDGARRELLKGLNRVGYKYATCIVGSGFRWGGNKNKHRFDESLKQPYIVDFNDPRFRKDPKYAQAGEGDPPPPSIKTLVGFASMDGGVLIVSKYPIEYARELIYKEGSFDDKHAKKGVVYARINKEGKKYHIFGTHAEAKDMSKRLVQFSILKKFIDEQKIPKNEPILIAGDMNVNRYAWPDRAKGLSLYFEKMVKILNASQPLLEGKEKFTSDAYKNSFKYKQEKVTLLDYILYLNDHQKPERTSYQIRIFTSKKPWDAVHSDLSDHYGMYGWFRFPE